MSMGVMYYANHTTLLCPWLVTAGAAGLSFYAHVALLIDEVDVLSHKVGENRYNFKLLKCIQMWSSK